MDEWARKALERVWRDNQGNEKGMERQSRHLKGYRKIIKALERV